MSDKLTLHSYLRCPFAMRVRMTLHEKNLEFEVIEEDLKNFSEALRKLHPQAKVPLLVHGSKVIYESSVITEYLDEAFPTPPLMPTDPGLRAETRLWTFWCNQIFKPDVDRLKYGKSRFPETECVGIDEKVFTHLQKLEERLQKSEWLVGHHLTLADIHVFPFYRQLSKVTPTPVFLAQLPASTKWLEKMTQRESFHKTMKP